MAADGSTAISTQRSKSARYAAFALAGLVLAEIVATPFAGAGLDRLPGCSGMFVPVGDLIVDGCIVAIALVVQSWARPRNAIGWLMLAFAWLGATQNLAEAYGVRAQGRTAFAAAAGTAGAVPRQLTVDTGRSASGHAAAEPVPRRAGRRTVLGLGEPGDAGRDDRRHGRRRHQSQRRPAGRDGRRPAVTLPQTFGTALAVVSVAVLVLCALASIGGAIWRTWRARAPQRQQLLLLLVTSAIVIVLTPLNAPPWLFDVGLVAVPAAVAVGVLRYRLLGVQVVIRRTLQFAVLTLLVVVVYAAVTAAMSALVSDETGSRVVAAAAVALVLLPLRDRLQTWVDRLVYGARRDPLGAIRQVGVSVSAVTADPLPAVTASVADAVRASYVVITDAGRNVLAETGADRGGPRLAYPLTVAGQQVGELVICPARGESAVPAADAQGDRDAGHPGGRHRPRRSAHEAAGRRARADAGRGAARAVPDPA